MCDIMKCVPHLAIRDKKYLCSNAFRENMPKDLSWHVKRRWQLAYEALHHLHTLH